MLRADPGGGKGDDLKKKTHLNICGNDRGEVCQLKGLKVCMLACGPGSRYMPFSRTR